MFGFMGKILSVDLMGQTIRVIEKQASFYKHYLGGAFLAAKLFEEAVAGIVQPTPLAPENPIIFATGPLAGTNLCGSTRVNVLSLSPEATGIYTSQGGGEFGPDIKRAGYDALVIRGESSDPVYLDIHNDAVFFKDAQTVKAVNKNGVTGFLQSYQQNSQSFFGVLRTYGTGGI
jgi:aldehyde:ferredoxin oxidoreductase